MPRGLHIIILLFDLNFLLFFSQFADVGGHALLRLSRRLFRDEDNGRRHTTAVGYIYTRHE